MVPSHSNPCWLSDKWFYKQAFLQTSVFCILFTSKRYISTDRRYLLSFYDDVIKWKHFPRNWPFVRGIHRSPVDSQKSVTRSFDIFFDLRLNKRLSKQSRRRSFEPQSRSLWRHCNAAAHKHNEARMIGLHLQTIFSTTFSLILSFLRKFHWYLYPNV